MPTNLDKIDHIVVLMFENRSFDNMLGWLYDPENEPPFDQVPGGQTFAGLSGKNLANPIPPDAAGSERGTIPVGRGTITTDPNPDPGEEHQHVLKQLNRAHQAPQPPSGCAAGPVGALLAKLRGPSEGERIPNPSPMDGFVADYIDSFAEFRDHPPSPAEYEIIMNCFTPAVLPVLSTLAYHYAVCDHWFCSVPSQTLPNRAFVHAATSHGFVNNNPVYKWFFKTNDTIFNRLQEAGLSWQVYTDRLNLISLTELVNPSLWPYHETGFADMEKFYQDAAEGTLPCYSFIEPRFFVDHNDQHPPVGPHVITSSVLAGELLINDVFQALAKGKNWDRTLLVITYDEHGGCYDHLSPPAAFPPQLDGPPGEENFRFDRLGVRVPTILISPLIEAGTIIHSQFDHTSIIKTITNRWGLAPLTERDKQARDLNEALTLDQARTDLPTLSPHHYQPTTDGNDEPLTHFHQILLTLIAGFAALEELDQARTAAEKVADLSKLVIEAGEISRLQTVGQAAEFIHHKLVPQNR